MSARLPWYSHSHRKRGLRRMADSSAQAEWPPLPGGTAGWTPRHVRPRVVVKADLLPGISVLSLLALLGIPLGWVWSRLAPATRVRVLPRDETLPLPMESWHRFADLGVFMLLGLAMGVIVGVAVWCLRGRRGPVVMLAAVAGSALSAVFAMRMGATFANSLYEVGSAPSVGDVLTSAPELSTAWIVLAQPLATAFTYAVLTIWNGRDDLGRRLA